MESTELSQEKYDKLRAYAVKSVIEYDSSPEEVVRVLEKGGMTPEQAQGVIQEMKDANIFNMKRQVEKKDRGAAYRKIAIGALFLVGGLIITILTYANASGGGRYVITYGAIIWGAIKLIDGLTDLK
ncbi:hypothetical protein [Sanyastnella coralliicola]|uniref:hypothetical protein n=1 Tax=Sanyastnella coralliicola TaxID=3069118 RepID=UPI0027B9E465|nr:hypothetical protein [Longitalea sp. SCSIO 12813]